MKHALSIGALVALLTAGPSAAAECYADYKAKQDSPLRLHYGVSQIQGRCAPGPAVKELQPRLAANGWTLLTVLSVFGPEGLAQRKGDAGANYLRY